MKQFFFLILYYFTYYFNLFFLLSLFCFNLASFVKLLFLLDNRNCHNRQKNQIKNTRNIKVPKLSIQVIWTPPAAKNMKLNVDERLGFRGLISDYQGH